MLAFYARPHPITEAAGRFDNLPGSVAALCAIIQGMLLHPAEAHRYGVRLARTRWRELALRDVAAMLQQSASLADAPLDQPRPPRQRLCGNCRSFAVLLCAMLRAQGVPARVRYGFATYLHPGFFTDHVICEYWEAGAHCWVRVDAMLDPILRDAYNFQGDSLNLSASAFLVAGHMLRLYRNQEISAHQIGLMPGGPSGMTFIHEGILHDLAALNAVEPLCQDAMLRRDQALGEEDWDCLANITAAPDNRLAEIQAAFHCLIGED